MISSQNENNVPLDDRRIGYDRAEIVLEGGKSRTLSKNEFEKLPLRERVDSIMHGKVKFFLKGVPISATRALKG